MKRWKFSTLFLFAVLVVGSMIYFSDTGSSVVHEFDDPGCGQNCFVDPDCEGQDAGDSCPDGTCVWFNPPGCCGPTLVCEPSFICCQGPGCDPFCDYPGCDPFDECSYDCGNGIPEDGEQCDDGNHDPGDGCSPWCTFEICGDGIVGYSDIDGDGNYEQEECDDGNNIDGDGCSSTCQLEGGPWCGNGEECVVDTDCDDDTTTEVCINGYCVEQEAGEECEDGNLEQGDGCFECQLEIDEQYQCADSSQRILKITSLSNAHAELWNGSGNYAIEICFDEIFGFDYNGQSPQECTGSNTVLRLADGTTSETNAHAERREESNPEYGLEVCYGDLDCRTIPANQDCAPEEKEIVSLSDATNAHLETNDSDQYVSASEYKVCCFSGGGGNVRWEKPLGVEINETSVNKSVYLVAYTGLSEGTSITFDIDECDDPGNQDPPCFLNEDIVEVSNLTDASGKATYNLKFTDEIMDAGSSNEANPELEFYFNASAPGTSFVSGILIVYPFEIFEPPVAIISSPVHGGIYFNGTNLTFDATNSENAEEFNWTIVYQGEIEFTDDRPLFNYSFGPPGMRTITLRVTNEDGFDEAQIAIVIVASSYMFAYINEPSHMQIVPNLDNERMVDYSSSDSFVTETTETDPDENFPCDVNVSCAAGYCPSVTQNIPPDCTDDVENLTVWGAPSSPEEADYGALFFEWAFSDEHQTISFSGYDNESGWVAYNVPSNALNDKTGELSLHFNISNTEEISEDVDRIFTLGQCLNNGNYYVFLNGSILSTSTPGVCAGEDGIIDGQYPDCCPVQWYCTDQDGDGNQVPAFCALNDEIDQCREYDNENDCNADIFDVAENDPAGDDLMCDSDEQQTGIECYWEDHDDGDSGNDECGIRLICEPNQGENGQCIDYICEYTYPAAECIDGLMTIEYILGLLPDQDPNEEYCDGYPINQDQYNALCGKDPVIVPCGRLNFELGFFDYTQFFAAALVILLIYLIVHSMQRRRRKE